MSRKDQAATEALDATIPLDNPNQMAHNATDGGTPTQNMDWRPPTALETPPAPAGFRYTWVRTSIGGEDDGDNIRKTMSQGYQPVLASEIPEGWFPPTMKDSRFARGQAIVGVRDMVLMKIPERMKKQRDAYYANRATTQVRQIDEALHGEKQRAGDKFFVDRKSNSELRSAPLDDES